MRSHPSRSRDTLCLIAMVSCFMAGTGFTMAAPARPVHDGTRVITFGKTPVSETFQTFSITKPAQHINASDLRPERVQMEDRFSYTYCFLEEIGETLPRLELVYRDGAGCGMVGAGWGMNLHLDLFEGMALDFISPVLIPYEARQGWYLLTGDEDIPVRRTIEEGRVVFTAPAPGGAVTHRFVQISAAGGAVAAVPLETRSSDKTILRFDYSLDGGRPLARRIHLPAGVLSLEYATVQENPGGTVLDALVPFGFRHRLTRMVLESRPSGNSPPRAQWDLKYADAADQRLCFLTGISCNTAGRSGRVLRFSYGALESNRSLLDARDLPKSSMWKRVENDPRWVLPERMRLSTSPGLRFTKLNQDMHWDLVDTQDRMLDAWIWDPANKGWKRFGDTYRPPRPSVMSASPTRPAGSHYSGLVKTYRDHHWNTYRFQSYIVSYYEPAPGRKGLRYRSYVCFPRVFGGVLRPDENGNVWDCDTHPLLQLPAPLQYEGEPWPDHLPGIASVERFDNQGARFVDFTRDGRLNLYYIGLRYRDAETGEVLLSEHAVHRDTGNGKELYQTDWEYLGERRRVKVDVCQALWDSRESVWKEDYPLHHDAPFWRRKDLGPDGKPTGRFVLPWHPDPAYHHHYTGFRSVAFATLDRDQAHAVHAVVSGRKGSGTGPEHTYPPAKDIYVLRKGFWQWEHLPPGSGYYPPEPFFQERRGTFLDVNDDGLDDAVIGTGPASERRAWINTGRAVRWEDVPAYHLPREVDLQNGGSLLLDLDFDGDQDLLVENGKVVYLNQTRERFGVRPFCMTEFTDAEGRRRKVTED